ncbi:MAG: aldo/keto reductase [Candidatus Anaerobiospirillum pullicola]|uniref:Aldo/keto reductase n=1 Tax=Candidatus Anaerobiospirillum pullicola TaxID=2838451 RepID=A0A948TED1_9GAMM|nr:aldo/keto reductase [Candidatus Anaerobiospirillum pullicola]
MEYTKFGQTDLQVSRICLGCMSFGQKVGEERAAWTLSEEDSRTILKAAMEQGINFFDTAFAYGSGLSEQIIGRAVRDFASSRDKVVLATKFLPRTKAEIEAGVTGAQHVQHHVEQSLKDLGTDYIDLYICHMWDYHTPIEEIITGMGEAVKAGKVRYLGFSNCYAWQLCKVNALAKEMGYAQISSLQGHYNLLFREEEREMIPYCHDAGIALTPYSPLASGRLVKKAGETSARLEKDSVAHSKYDRTAEQDAIIIQRVAEVAERNGFTTTQVALGWLLSKVTAPIVGATKMKHLNEAVAAADVKLSPEDIAYLEEPYVPHRLVGVMEFNHA